VHHPQPTHPYSSVLRQRAVHLRELAAAIERSPVTALPDAADDDGWTSPRAELCERILRRNVHQLHAAADDLRETALRLRRRADELDLARRSVA
jgi:hypothetical protein